MGTFLDKVRAGTVEPAAIDDFIDAWHESDSELGLAQYLGMTDAQYAHWFARPQTLAAIAAEGN